MHPFTSPKVELFYRCLKQPRVSQNPIPKWENILICNQGGLGDVFLSNLLVDSIRQAHQSCKISMLTTPQGKVAAKNIDFAHLFPYWFRSGEKKGMHYLRFAHFLLWQKREIAREISRYKYDCAIVPNPYFSGMAHLLSDAKIPCRVGFETMGDRNYLTEIIPWRKTTYIIEHYKSMLLALGIKPQPFEKTANNEDKHIVIHMFSADPRKDLPLSFWMQLYSKLIEGGYSVVFTGKGGEQRKKIAKMANHSYNLCDQLDWEGFQQVIQTSSMVISVDTAAVHIAASYQKPFIAIYRHTPHFDVWFPRTKKGRAFHWPVTAQEVFQEVKHESCC